MEGVKFEYIESAPKYYADKWAGGAVEPPLLSLAPQNARNPVARYRLQP
jgi:hypothetical protein